MWSRPRGTCLTLSCGVVACPHNTRGQHIHTRAHMYAHCNHRLCALAFHYFYLRASCLVCSRASCLSSPSECRNNTCFLHSPRVNHFHHAQQISHALGVHSFSTNRDSFPAWSFALDTTSTHRVQHFTCAFIVHSVPRCALTLPRVNCQ